MPSSTDSTLNHQRRHILVLSKIRKTGATHRPCRSVPSNILETLLHLICICRSSLGVALREIPNFDIHIYISIHAAILKQSTVVMHSRRVRISILIYAHLLIILTTDVIRGVLWFNETLEILFFNFLFFKDPVILETLVYLKVLIYSHQESLEVLIFNCLIWFQLLYIVNELRYLP